MIFTDLSFFVFFAICIILSITIKQKKMHHYMLLLMSLIFYGWWDWRFVGLLLISSYIAYITPLLFLATKRKVSIAQGIIFLLFLLLFFKYANFLYDNALVLLNTISGKSLNRDFNIILPVGISFFIFQSISYVVDSYRKPEHIEYSFLRVATYISFFPQLVAGPIVRSKDFLNQLDEVPKIEKQNIINGAVLFIQGYIYKVLIAEKISVLINPIYENPIIFTSQSKLFSVIGFYSQIYFDFQGYSLMAIGTALILGYNLVQNFDYPYVSKNIVEFWRRWHLSLSSWLKDYLYIPLGGNRKGELKRYRNLFLTMLIGGLWHGANWRFIIWGALHGSALAFTHLIANKTVPLKQSKFGFIYSSISWLVTQVFVIFCWMIFRMNNISDFRLFFADLLGVSGILDINYNWFLVTIPIIFDHVIIRKIEKSDFKINSIYSYFAIGAIIALILFLIPNGVTEFIYFQF